MLRPSVVWCALSIILIASLAPAADDGVYTGKTSQNRDISLTVTEGAIDEYSISWACGGTSATVTTFTDCAIAADGTFSCGSSTCPGAPYVANIEISGAFAGSSVSGSYDLAYNTGGFAGTWVATFNDDGDGWTADGRTHGYGDVEGLQQRFTVDNTGFVTGFVMIPGGKS